MSLIREARVVYRGPRVAVPPVLGPEDVAAFARKVIGDDAREHFLVIYLDGRHRPIAYSVLSVGTLAASLVHPREVFRAAIMMGAGAVVISHSHPSGDPEPSREDIVLTRRLVEAGVLLGIPLLDHVIVGNGGGHVSFRERGWSASPAAKAA